ncbi:hypothetical protein D3C80_1686830 [compost metagenome]
MHLQLVVQAGAGYPQALGGPGAVAVARGQGGEDGLAFGGSEAVGQGVDVTGRRQRLRGGQRGGCSRRQRVHQQRADGTGRERACFVAHLRPLQQVAQLTHIAWPGLGLEQLQGVLGQFQRRLAGAAGDIVQQVLDQRRQVLPPLA